jgi:hypothetical protein
MLQDLVKQQKFEQGFIKIIDDALLKNGLDVRDLTETERNGIYLYYVQQTIEALEGNNQPEKGCT